LKTDGFHLSDFQAIPVSKTTTTEFDVAELHDMSGGGVFEIVSQ
jgi:hypothetical protein